jgi:uncharacterized protein YqgC (DUF456 family)
MNTFLIVAAILLVVVGLIGSVVPGLAGPPFSWAGLLILHLTAGVDFTSAFLIATAAAAVVITVMDYIVPSFFTKRHGGSKAGVRGCNIGLVISIVGLPFGPQGLLGVVFWPFAGALAGELIGGKQFHEALKAAWGAFLGFLTGTGLKLAYAIFAIVMVVKALF